MKYIGNKTRLIGFIEECLRDSAVEFDNSVVYDLFSGTGSVSELFLRHNCKVLSCDNMNYAIAEQYRKLFFRKEPEFEEIENLRQDLSRPMFLKMLVENYKNTLNSEVDIILAVI